MESDEERDQSSLHLNPPELTEVLPLSKQQVEDALKKFPDIVSLRSEQEIAIKNIYERQDTMVILPTGYGKSLVYQLLPEIHKIRGDMGRAWCINCCRKSTKFLAIRDVLFWLSVH